MHICFVIPPSPYLLSDRSTPWLGPLWSAAWLRDRGHKVSVLDLTGHVDYIDFATRSVLGHRDVDCYGLTATTPDYYLALEIGKTIKSLNPSARLILGGAHASTSSDLCMGDGWDAIVSGEGFYATEKALVSDGIISATNRDEVITDIDMLPFPARDLIDLDSYRFTVVGERATAVMTSFGCPMGCTFCCGRDLFVYRKLRAFSPAKVLQEWDTIRETYPQFTALQDYADEWNIPSERAIILADSIAAHHNKWLIRCFVKAEFLTDDVAKAMSRAGVVEVLCGIESGSARMLKVIKKHTTPEINHNARNMAKKWGIRFKAATMVGLPTETREDALMTKQWLLEAKPDEFDVTVFQPMKGSPIADRPDKEGKGLHFITGNVSMLPYKTAPGENQTLTYTDGLSSEEILELRNEIDRDVRAALGIPVTPFVPNESSMGQRTMAK